MTEESAQVPPADGQQFMVLRVYLKDVSFETPNSPAVFKQEWDPEINLQLNSGASQVEPDLYEVVLNVTVTAKHGDRTAFLAEVQQAGLFTIKGFEEAHKSSMLGAYCPNLLFPFVREAVADLVSKGGFPQLLLAPINFEAIYAQNLEKISAQVSTPGQGA